MEQKSKKRLELLWVLVLIGFTGGILVAGCGGDDDEPTEPPQGFIISQEQAGVWEWTMTLRDCTTGDPIPGFPDDVVTETLCPGIDYADEQLPDCTIEILSSNSFRGECRETQTISGCTMTATMDVTFTFETESFTGTGDVTVTFSGSGCAGMPDICGDFLAEGERTGPVPEGECGKGRPQGLELLYSSSKRLLQAAVSEYGF
jgi:hypothetical protein